MAGDNLLTAPATEAAREWQGWGTALKPALEPITMARKPLVGTVAANVLEHGTGAINVDGCRVAANDGRPLIESRAELSGNAYGNGLNGSRCAGVTTQGRWPANLIHSGCDEVLAGFPVTVSGGGNKRSRDSGMWAGKKPFDDIREVDTGSAARFFYCAKASKKDRGANTHPTVKPTDLMRYLCRLVTPPNGVVLDPFMGSGSTGKAAVMEGFNFIGIEREADYIEIARARIDAARPESDLFGGAQ
jgi:site-specific DNA-methyltransferase (adenine-specific)